MSYNIKTYSRRQRNNFIARSFWISVCVLVLFLCEFTAQAASIRISPVNVEMPATQKATALTLTNMGSEAVSLQLRTFVWSQADGKDELISTDRLMISPPAVTVPAGKSYTVRIARSRLSSVSSEESYRLFIDELPRPVDARTLNRGVSMILRTSVPVFVVDEKAFAQLSWRIWQDTEGLHARVTNNGKRHAKISQLMLTANNVAASFGEGLNGYVLSGTSRQFTIARPDPRIRLTGGKTAILTAKDGYLPIKETLHVQ
ncbi:TPA: molecular chaperone [Klebsiella michiganensis]|nr:molecular chaperone [Klebsiella michiganensis]